MKPQKDVFLWKNFRFSSPCVVRFSIYLFIFIKMTCVWNITHVAFVPALTQRHGSSDDWSRWTYCSLPEQPLLEQHNNRGNTQRLLGSVYWRLCARKNPTTIWRRPDCPPIDALLIFALSLLYVLENVVDWIFSSQTPPLQLFAQMQSPIFVYFEN